MLAGKSRRQLARENRAMRDALSWYAAKETWRRKGIHPHGAPRKQWRKSPAAFDRGHLAIRTLTEWPEKPSVGPLSRFLARFTRNRAGEPSAVTVPAPLPKVD